MVYTSRIRGNADRRPKAFWGALIPAALNFVGGLITTSRQAKAQKEAIESQKELAQQQLNISNQNNLAATLNNSVAAQDSYSDEDYNLKYRNGGTRRLGTNSIVITDGGNARKIGSDTFLLRGGSHEDINETGQTGIGINVGGNEIEAEGGEVAQKKNGSLRIFSAQPMLSGGLSPAQAILRGYNKDKVFAAQQRFKKNNHLNDDGSKFSNGGSSKKTVHFYKSKSGKVFNNYNEALYDNKLWNDDIVYRYNRKGDLYHQKYGLREHTIPFQKQNAITLRNAGRASGAIISPNQLDSIAKYANKAGLSIPTAFGMVMKESTFNNPTDTKSAAKLFGLKKGTREYNNWTTGQHFQGNGSRLDTGNAREFINFHKDDSLNPYWQDMRYVENQAKNINQAKKMLLNGERNADKRAKSSPKLTGGKKINVMEAAFRDYKTNPYGYNPGQKDYVQLVNQNAKDIMNSPQIQQWYRTSPYAKGKKYKCGGRIKAEDGTRISLNSSYRTIPDGGVPGTDSYSSKMRSGYNASPLVLFNALHYLDQAQGFVDENGNSRYITGIVPTAGRGKISGRGKTLASIRNARNNVKPRNNVSFEDFKPTISPSTETTDIRQIINQTLNRRIKLGLPSKSTIDIKNARKNYNIAKMQAANAELRNDPLMNQVRYANGQPIIVNTKGYYTTFGKTIERSAKNMTNDANPFLYMPRTTTKPNINIPKVSGKTLSKIAGYSTVSLLPTIGAYYVSKRNDNKNETNKTQLDVKGQPIFNYIARPQIQKTSSNKTTVEKDSTSIPDSIRRPQAKKDSVLTPIFKQALGKDSVKKDSVKPTRTIVKQQKSSPIRKDTIRVDTTKQVVKAMVQQKKPSTPQYKGNVTKGNYQLHDGETKTINGIKYSRVGNNIINHKTNVAYVYDKNGNYTGQADYSKVGKNFNDAFDAARAAGRSQFIYRAGKYNNYSTAKEEDAKKEALNRRVGARRIAKRLGGLEPPRRRYEDGGSALPELDIVAKNKRGFGEWNNYIKNSVLRQGIPNVPYQTSAYTPKVQSYIDLINTPYNGRQNTFKPATQDYIGLGIDTLATLGSGMFTRSAYDKLNFDYNLPSYVDETPVAFDTTYHNEAQRANVERNRINGRNLIQGNTASAQASLARMQQGDTNAMLELNKLADEKANKEVELRNQNAANEQQVRARNAAARNQYYQNVAQIQNAALEAKNNAALAKAQSIGSDFSSLSQAWSNFATSVENRYDARQNEIAAISSANNPSVVKNAISLGYNFSPEVLANLYKNSKNDELRSIILGRLSTNERKRYGIK